MYQETKKTFVNRQKKIKGEDKEMLKVKRLNKRFQPDCSRIIVKPHIPKDENRIRRIIMRVLDLNEEIVKEVLDAVIKNFSCRHKNIWDAFDMNFNEIKQYIRSRCSN